MTGDAELAAEYDRARGYDLPPHERPRVRAHLVGLTDEERDLLRGWWDEETTVSVESSFPIISRIIAARAEALVEHICWEQFDCAREWAECDHALARALAAGPSTDAT